MSVSPYQFLENITLPSSAAQIGTYQTPALTVDKVYEIFLCNTHTSPVSVDLWFVPAAGSRQASTKKLDAQHFIMAAGETKTIGMEQRLSAGAQIHGAASTASVVSIGVSGDRVS